ncbi:hypothetical protein [Silvanigrella sp.]|uniref:hypothetical protein n=1 Tax=Silvanigrella sp. TaxID=2024976 RepID=UPI0037CA7327
MEYKEVESKVMCDFRVAYNIAYKEAKEEFNVEKQIISSKLIRIKYMLIAHSFMLFAILVIYYLILMNNLILFSFLSLMIFNINTILDFRRHCRDLELKT